MTTMRRAAVSGLAALAMLVSAGRAANAQTGLQMPDPKTIAGVPLPDPSLPAGTISVRVIRGDFTQNVAGQAVELIVDGRSERLRTGDDGRVQRSGLPSGARVRAIAEVNGERLESQEITVGAGGIRVVLVATDPGAEARAAEADRLAKGPAERGIVVLGPQSRVVLQIRDDRLIVFYLFEILNSARTPVDIGGPLVFELPTGARGVGFLEGSSPQATAQGPRIVVTGPFAPGTTLVDAAYELPHDGPSVTLRQEFPVALPQLLVAMPQMLDVDFTSPQIQTKQPVLDDQGTTMIVGRGPAIAAGSTLALDITGLPFHPRWPRRLALSLAAGIMALGLWVAFVPRRRVA